MFRRIHLIVPFDMVKPTIGPLIGGTPNQFYPLALFMNDNTPKNQVPVTDGSMLDRYSKDNEYHYHAEIDLELFNLQVCGLVLQNGGEILSYPTFAKVVPTDLVPGKDVTWQAFVDSEPTIDMHTFVEGSYVATTVLSTEDPKNYLPMSQAAGLFGFENLLTEKQFFDLQANQPVPETEPEDEPLPE